MCVCVCVYVCVNNIFLIILICGKLKTESKEIKKRKKIFVLQINVGIHRIFFFLVIKI